VTGYLFFGTESPTNNGTSIQGYIHVTDLTDAHIEALDYLRQSGQSTLLNCGYEHGYSVREVIQIINEVQGQPLAIEENPKRLSDPREQAAEV
jgi:UDP-glucose 4-epimerase